MTIRLMRCRATTRRRHGRGFREVKCGTALRYDEDATEVQCGECGTRYRVVVTVRHRGGGLQLGLLSKLRQALGKMPGCTACQGTGVAQPAAVERAATRAMLKGVQPPAVARCSRCEGTGKRRAAR